MNQTKKEEDVNLIDLKEDVFPSDASVEGSAAVGVLNAGATDEDCNTIFDDFDQLTLVEQPNSPKNSKSLQQTLEDCIGYLHALPLKQPNCQQKNSSTVVEMINILSNPDAAPAFEEAMKLPQTPQELLAMDSRDYKQRQLAVYDHDKSDVMQKFLALSKKTKSHSKAPGFLGVIVKPGCMSLYTKNGITFAVGEGRWWFTPFNVLAKWKYGSGMNISLDHNYIEPPDTQVMVVRIIEGTVGLVIEQGVHKLLDVGTHVYNSGTVKFLGRFDYAQQNKFRHGPYNYVNVPRGKYAKVWVEVEQANGQKSVVPRLLKEGEHFIVSNLFKNVGFVAVETPNIAHGAVHVLNVSKGSVAKVDHDNAPRLLGEGEHIVESTQFFYHSLVSIVDTLCIVHGTITILRVPRGKIALAWNRNEPMFIDCPGLYEFNSEDFQFVQFKDASDREIELGAKKVLQVYTGEVGITYNAGKLVILTNGRHVIKSSTHLFERFLSTKQRSIRLISLGADEKMSRSMKGNKKFSSATETGFSNEINNKAWHSIDDKDLLVCETKDLVKVGVRADVFYSIQDPDKCIRNLDTEQLEDLVRETAVATLTNIIRSTALNQIAQSKNVSASTMPPTPAKAIALATDVEQVCGETDQEGDSGCSNEEEEELPISLFFDRAHDEFMSKLHDDFIRKYGVDIANIRMEAFKIMDSELAGQISQHVLTTAQVENELANLEGQSLIATQKERTSADVDNINAQAQAKSLKTRSDAENKRTIDAARAAAEAMKIKFAAQADAEAAAILTKAKAQAESTRLQAAAEAERAQRLSETPLGQQERLLSIYKEMVTKSNEGVSKVIYLDPSVNRDSPFALGSLDGLNRNLQSLTKLGVAASSQENQ